MKRPKIQEVFTPRNSEINEKVYVKRASLEKAIKRTLEGSLHGLIYGESGSGKSWLYKKIVQDTNVHCVIANCANASRLGSLTQEIVQAIIPVGSAKLESYSEKKEAEVNVAIAKGSLNHTNNYRIEDGETLARAFEKMREQANNKLSLLVLDNLEAIFSDDSLMSELGNIITLLDDNRYAKYKIKMLIVGVPSGVKEYFSKIKNLPTIANRIQEIPEIAPLSKEQVNELSKKGFIESLKIQVDPTIFAEFQNHIYNVTLGIAQRVQEYCEQLAYKIEDNNWVATLRQLDEADDAWLGLGFQSSWIAIESMMNKIATKVTAKQVRNPTWDE